MKKISAMLTLVLMSTGIMSAQTVTAPEAPFKMEPLVMYQFPSRDFNITRYGAKPDDVKANIAAFAKAVAACNKAGGGHVVVPAGTWLSGPIHLKDNVDLHLSEGARVLFVDDPQLYLPEVHTSWEGLECYNYSPLVYAFGCSNVGISGPGKLEAKMELWEQWFGRPKEHLDALRRLYSMAASGVDVEYRHMVGRDANLRPHLIQFNRCTNVNLDGFSILNSPFWTIHVYLCKDVYAHGLNVFAHGHNNDGIDIEGTSHVIVENCIFDQGDDAVVIKSGRNQDAWRLASPTQDVVVRNCEIREGHCLMGIGSEISGGVRRVYMHDCTTTKDAVKRVFYLKTNERRGAVLEDITMENVNVKFAQKIFAIDTDILYQWANIAPTYEVNVTQIRNITMRNVKAQKAEVVYEVRGDKRMPVDGVRLENIQVDTVTKYFNNLENCRNITIKDVSYKNLIKK